MNRELNLINASLYLIIVILTIKSLCICNAIWINFRRYLLALLLFYSTVFAAKAQKLPVVQKINVRAPANVKIDGRADEWGNKFQAYNHALDIYYTMANDDENLYIVIQAKEIVSLFKITSAGLKFMINNRSKTTDEGAVAISFPYFEYRKTPLLDFKGKPAVISGDSVTIAKADSFMRACNKKLDNTSKDIKVIGVLGIDTLISVYNDTGIMARQAFDNTFTYTCELAVPIKYLGLQKGKKSFIYHFVSPKVNSEAKGIRHEINERGKMIISAASSSVLSISRADDMASSFLTDFWGEYTLAKKPK